MRETSSQIVWQLTGPRAGRAGWCIKHVCAQLLLIASVNSLKRRALGSPPYPVTHQSPVQCRVARGRKQAPCAEFTLSDKLRCVDGLLRSQRLLPPPRRANATLSPLSSPRQIDKSVTRQPGLLACLLAWLREIAFRGSPFTSFLFLFSAGCKKKGKKENKEKQGNI